MSPEDTKLIAIVRRLFEKTKGGHIPWEAGEDPNVFAISFTSGTVAIERVPATEEEAESLSFRISNDENVPIVELSAFEAKQLGFAEMQEFFYSARRKALRLSQTLDALSAEIEDLLREEK